MSSNFKFSYVNINKQELASELNKKGVYYSNVVMWTVLFSLPLFWLLDFLFVRFAWVDMMLVRLIVTIISYIIYIFGNKKEWNYILTVTWFIAVNVLMHAIFCGVIPINFVLPYFLILSVVILLINTAIFWPPVYSIITCLFTYAIIILIFSFQERFDKYNLLISHGGGVYFVVSAFSCLIAFNRHSILKREIAKNILIDEANNRMLEQNEKISDQKYVIEDANRKLKVLNDYRHNTLNIMLHDFRNFTGSIQMSLDLLKNKSDNLSVEQKEILNYISAGNEKLNYLSEKLAASADRDEAKVQFTQEKFDISPFVEQAVLDTADAAQIRQINLQLHLSASPIIVYLDKLFLSQVLFKLLTNAIKYAETGSILTVHTNRQNDKCVIEVINIGKLVGIAKMNELFTKLQPYRSLKESVQNDSEMGFSVAKKLTETMGGTFTYNSSETTHNFYRIEFTCTQL